MKDLSGPAFPTVEEQYSGMDGRWGLVTTLGMTKRELIAMGQMKALRGANGDLNDVEYLAVEYSKVFARIAIQDADALLAELGRE